MPQRSRKKTVQQSNQAEKKIEETENNGKVMELEVKTKEKAQKVKAVDAPGGGIQVDSVAQTKAASELGDANQGAGDDAAATDKMASKASFKAELALNNIKTAMELRSKARKMFEDKGKPIPEVLQKGALVEMHQRVVDAQAKLTARFGANAKGNGKMMELESKVQAKKTEETVNSAVDPAVAKEVVESNAEAEAASMQVKAAKKEAAQYKEKYKLERIKEKATADATKINETALEQNHELDKKIEETENNGKVLKLEMNMEEKVKEKHEEKAQGKVEVQEKAESDAEFNHKQITQEAYNKQVMAYELSWEKAHGGSRSDAKYSPEKASTKAYLKGLVNNYETQHESIEGIMDDIHVSDAPTSKAWEKAHRSPDKASTKLDIKGFVSHYEDQHESLEGIMKHIHVSDTPTPK